MVCRRPYPTTARGSAQTEVQRSTSLSLRAAPSHISSNYLAANQTPGQTGRVPAPHFQATDEPGDNRDLQDQAHQKEAYMDAAGYG